MCGIEETGSRVLWKQHDWPERKLNAPFGLQGEVLRVTLSGDG